MQVHTYMSFLTFAVFANQVFIKSKGTTLEVKGYVHGEGNIRGSALDTVHVVDTSGDVENAFEKLDKRQGKILLSFFFISLWFCLSCYCLCFLFLCLFEKYEFQAKQLFFI